MLYHKTQYYSRAAGSEKSGGFMLHCWRDTEICGKRQELECCLLSCHRWSFSGALYCVTRIVERRPETSPATYILAHVLDSVQYCS